MRRNLLDSPIGLGAVTTLGGWLSISGFISFSKVRETRAEVFISAGCVLLGIVGLYWGAHTLRQGIQNERWPATVIDPVRRIVEHPAFSLVLLLSLLAMSVALVAGKPYHVYFWGAFQLVQTMSQLNGAFRRPPARPPSGVPFDWRVAAPIQSDHWGER